MTSKPWSTAVLVVTKLWSIRCSSIEPLQLNERGVYQPRRLQRSVVVVVMVSALTEPLHISRQQHHQPTAVGHSTQPWPMSAKHRRSLHHGWSRCCRNELKPMRWTRECHPNSIVFVCPCVPVLKNKHWFFFVIGKSSDNNTTRALRLLETVNDCHFCPFHLSHPFYQKVWHLVRLPIYQKASINNGFTLVAAVQSWRHA